MIVDKKELYERINSHKFCSEAFSSTEQKIKELDVAISRTVNAIGLCQPSFAGRMHLAYSGGVDSSVILMKILQGAYPVTVHTMGATENHPDVVYATSFVKQLKERGWAIEHLVHIITPSEEDIEESNRLLGVTKRIADNYYLLMKVLKPHTANVVCCDCIDELLGGYHMHRNPKEFFPLHSEEKTLRSNRFAALNYYLSCLIPDHLFMLDTFSNHFGIKVYLPYGSGEVMRASGDFDVRELVDDEHRKKPIYAIAKQNNIPQGILDRRKYGLVSAFHEVTL